MHEAFQPRSLKPLQSIWVQQGLDWSIYRGEVASSYNTALLSPAARRDDAGSSATQNLQDDPEAHERSLVELGQNEDDKPGFDRKRRTGKVSTASVNRSCSDVVSSGCEQDR